MLQNATKNSGFTTSKGKCELEMTTKKRDNFCLIGNTITTPQHLKKRQIDKLSSISTAKQVYFKIRKMIQKKQFICICMRHVRNFQLSTENPLDQDCSFTHLIYSTQGTVQELHVCHTMCPCVIHCTCTAECPPAMRELGSSLCERIWVTMYTEMNRLYYIL